MQILCYVYVAYVWHGRIKCQGECHLRGIFHIPTGKWMFLRGDPSFTNKATNLEYYYLTRIQILSFKSKIPYLLL